MQCRKKRIQKPNFARSSRHEMVQLMLEFGIVTTAGLKMLDGSLKTHQRMLTKLKKEGLASSVGTAHGGCGTYLVDVANKGSDYLRDMGNMSFYSYNEVKSLTMRAQRQDDSTTKRRVFRASEVAMMFYASGIPTLNGEKRLLEDIDKSYRTDSYYSVLECKRYYERIKDVSAGHNANARMLGVYNTASNVYPVYKAEGKMIRVYATERYACNLIQELFFPEMRIQGLESCIFFYEDDKVAADMIMPNPQLKELTTTLLTSKTDYYEHIYLLPYRRESQPLLRQMGKDNWRWEFIKTILPPEHLARKSPVEYADAIDGNCLEYVFCIPDAKTFSRFITLTHQRQNPDFFRVYCYPYQEPLVRSLVKAGECQLVVV